MVCLEAFLIFLSSVLGVDTRVVKGVKLIVHSSEWFNPLRGIPRTLVRGGIANSPLRGQALHRLQRVDPTDVSPWSFSKRECS
jgi:hypothetical protein